MSFLAKADAVREAIRQAYEGDLPPRPNVVPPTHVSLEDWIKWRDISYAGLVALEALTFQLLDSAGFPGDRNFLHAHVGLDFFHPDYKYDPNNIDNSWNLFQLSKPSQHSLERIIIHSPSTSRVNFSDFARLVEMWRLFDDKQAQYADGTPLTLNFKPSSSSGREYFASNIDAFLNLPRDWLGITIELPPGAPIPVTINQLENWPELFRTLPDRSIDLSADLGRILSTPSSLALVGGLAADRLNKIIITDPVFAADYGMRLSELTENARWIELAVLADGRRLQVRINDDADAVSAALVSPTLRADLIARIEFGGALTVDTAHARDNLTGAWALIAVPDYRVVIRDSAADLSLYLSQGQLPIATSRIELLEATDSGAVTLPVSAFIQRNEEGLVALLQQLVVEVRDTAANLQENLAYLHGQLDHIDRIVASDGGHLWFEAPDLTAGTFNNLIEKLYDETSQGQARIDVHVTGGTIGQYTSDLRSHVQSGLVDEIVVTDDAPVRFLSVADFEFALSIVERLRYADGTPIRVALEVPLHEVQGRLDFLQDNVALLASVTVSDLGSGQRLELTTSDVVRDGGVLAVLDSNVPLRIIDAAANIDAQHSAVFALGERIYEIFIANYEPIRLSIAEAVLGGGHAPKLRFQDGTPGTAIVHGTGQEIVSSLSELLANVGHIAAIALTEQAPIQVPLSAFQWSAEVLDLIRAPDGSGSRVLFASGSSDEIAAALDAMQDLHERISHVLIEDQRSSTVTLAELQRNGDVLALIRFVDQTPHTLIVSDQLSSVLAGLDGLQDYVDAHPGVIARIDATVDGGHPVLLADFVARNSGVLSLIHNAGNGSALSFLVQGSAAQALANLDALQDRAYQIVRVDLTDNAGIPQIGAAQLARDLPIIQKSFNADGSGLDIAVADTAMAVGAHIDQLAAGLGHIHGQITITDSKAVPVTVAQIVAHGELLARLADADGTSYELVVTDSASSILAGLQQILANGHVVSVSIADTLAGIVAAQDALAGSGAQISSVRVVDTVDNALASLQLLSGQISIDSIRIVDTAANVGGHLEELLPLAGEIDGIFITDAQTAIRLNTEQLSANGPLLDLIENAFTIEIAGSLADVRAGLADLPARAQLSRLIVEDTAEVIAANYDDIYVHGLTTGANFSSIVIVSDNQPVVLDSVADALRLAHSAGIFFLNADGSQAQVSFSDTAAAIAFEIHEFISRVPGSIASITITDSAPLLIGLSWLSAPGIATFVAKLHNADGSAATPSFFNSASGFNEGGLALLSANLSELGHFVVIDDAPLTLSAAVAVASADALARLVQADGSPVRIQVTDTAAAISANFDALAALPGIVGMLAPDAPIALTAAQIASGAPVLDVMGRQYVGPTAFIDHHYKLNVHDSAANVSAEFDAIMAFARDGLIETIGISDAPAALTLTGRQFAEGRAALLVLNAGQYPFQIVDTAEGISAHGDTLRLSAGHSFQGFVITDDEPLTGSLSFAEWAGRNGQRADGSGLEFHVRDTAYGITSAPLNLLDLTGVSLTGLTILDTDTLSMGVLIRLGVLDTASTADGAPLNLEGTTAEIAANLEVLHDRIDSLGVVRSDSMPLVLTAAEAVEHAALLAKLQQQSWPEVGWQLKTVQIADTGANITAQFDELSAIVGTTGIRGVHVTDTEPVALTASQYAANAALLANFGILYDGPTHSSPSGYEIALTGSAAEITGLLDRLRLDTHVATIAINDPATPIVLDVSTVVSAADALARIAGDHVLYVNATTTEIGALLPNRDDAIHLDALQANGHVASIRLLDATLPLVLTPGQQTANAAVLATIEDAFYLVVGSPGAGIAYTGSLVVPNGWLVDATLLDNLIANAPSDARYSPLFVPGTSDVVVAWSVGGLAHAAVKNGDGHIVVTITDTEDVRDYATIVSTYLPSGILLASLVTYDDDSTAQLVIDLGGMVEDSGSFSLSAVNLIPGLPGATLTDVVIEAGLGTLVDNQDGTWTFTPAANDNRSVLFAFAMTDGPLTLWSTAGLDLTPANDAPIAEPVALSSMVEDGTRVITAAELLVGAADIDTAAAELSITSLTIQSGSGTLTDNGDGTWSYTPASDDDTGVTFAYTVSDGELTTTSTAALDILPVNDAPVAQLVTLAPMDEDGRRLIRFEELLAGVSDEDTAAGELLVTSLSLLSGSGTLTDNGDSWTYAPAINDDTSAVFAYTVSDGEHSASSTAELDIMPANDAPIAAPVALAAMTEDGTRLITAAELLVGVSDIDPVPGDHVITSLTLQSGSGTLTDNGDGTWTYAPTVDDDAYAAFEYTVSDGELSAASWATLDITPVNDAPVAHPVALGDIAEDGGPRLITAAELLAGASDVDTAAGGLSITSLTLQSGRGTLTDNGDGTWTYALAADDDTDVVFEYTVSDGELDATSTAMLDITPVKDAPMAEPVTLAAILEDGGPRLITAAELLAGASDVDTAAGGLSITSLTLQSGYGTLTDNGDDTWTFVSSADDDTAVTFSYTVSDGELETTSTAILDITPVNDAPVIAGGAASSASVAENSLAVTTVAANDVDAGTTLVYSIAGGADGALLTIDPSTGAVSFKSAPDFETPADADSDNVYHVDIEVSDGALAARQALAVTVADVNEAPRVGDLVAEAGEDGPPITLVADYLDTDANDAPFLSIDAGATTGDVIDRGDGTFLYSAGGAFEFLAGDEIAYDTFTYKVTDAGGLSGTATVTLTIRGANDPVEITGGELSGAVVEDTDGATSINGTIGFGDADLSDMHTASFTASPGNATTLGAFSLGAPGGAPGAHRGTIEWSYALDQTAAQALAKDQTVIETYTVAVSDGQGSTAIRDVVVTIRGTNDAPTVSGVIHAVASPGTALIVAASALLENTTDVDADALTLISVQDARNGAVAIRGDDVVFTPSVGHAGPASFSYSVSDGQGGTATGTVNVLVDAYFVGGTTAADRILGASGADLIDAGIGNDRAWGGAGNDIFLMAAGDGNDYYHGGPGSDTIDFSQGEQPASGARLNLSKGTSSRGNAYGFDIFRSIENVIGTSAADVIGGSSAANYLEGRDGDDTLSGYGGSDVLIGGAGNDRLTGGSGIDYFVFEAPDFGHDVVTDFAARGRAHDVLRFGSDVFASIADVLAHSEQAGRSVIIRLDSENSITLLNTKLSLLSATPGVIEID